MRPSVFRMIFLMLTVATPATWAQTGGKQNGEAVEWPSIVCRGAKCEPMQAKGWLFAKPGQKMS